MNDLNQHYSSLLGLDSSWSVEDVDLDLSGNQVVIRLAFVGGSVCCPECNKQCARHDTALERTWRHLDTMQFKTEIRAAVPCSDCGVKTVAVLWAGKHSRFTLMFEVVAIKVLQAAANVKRAADLLGLNWEAMHSIIERAVDRGLARRDLEDVHHVGIDEKRFGRGQDYISLMTDLDNNRVLEVTAGRTIESCDKLWETLPDEQRAVVTGVSMNMWQAFMSSASKNVPEAEIVHDKFHISKHLSDAVDKVRRQEDKQLRSEGDDRLKGTRQLWLYNEDNLDEDRYHELLTAMRNDLKTGRAWAIKENFGHFWTYVYAHSAEGFFDRWYGWAIRSRLEPIKKVARMLKEHLGGILSYFRHRITNAITEGFNSRIQSINSAARGFRNFANYRLRVLFYCGKLEMVPDGCH
ncbi:ISL3 family transposase [Rhodopirellula sp. SWK7]|uniref:ISL3 family transposase n=1 Tax=Rhodopirellula sp. SWK7 TaxID=595460 RepID=UPI0002BF51F2|nr:ISL3 family transposase [Rhodopirellula sp. SWK7]EMI41668.1 transposase IS204/IS1001/IS1096/IS1165 family protein [Rhodopirellula sp. SWK7]